MRLMYVDLEQWKRDAKADGYAVRKVTVSKFNTYYQAFKKDGGGLVGFFNTWEGTAGKSPEHKAVGELTRKSQ